MRRLIIRPGAIGDCIVSTGLDLVGITEPPMAELASFDSIVSWYGTARPEFRDAVAGSDAGLDAKV